MNKAVVLLLVVLASAVIATIYQKDDRKDEYQVSYRVKNLGRGVGIIVPRSQVIGNRLDIAQTSSRSRYKVCQTTTGHFLEDLTVQAATCSGFLLAADVFATAGTCVFNNDLVNDCQNLAIVFNYATTSQGNTRSSFSGNEIFYCNSVLTASVPRYLTTVINATTGLSRTDFLAAPNYAVLKLDRTVSQFGLAGYSYFRSLKNLHVNEKTYTIGHPLGLSKKYDDGGRIWAIDGGTTGRGIKIFTNSDTFQGSLGSPIFDADGRIIAMHTGGNPDFYRQRNTDCNLFVNCTTGITEDDDDCHEGELGMSICYFKNYNGAIEDCATAVGNKRNLPPGVNENIHRFNVTNPVVKAASDYYGVN